MKRVKKEDDYETTITFKLRGSLKEAFTETCEDMDTTVSRELREFMKRYIAKNAQVPLL